MEKELGEFVVNEAGVGVGWEAGLDGFEVDEFSGGGKREGGRREKEGGGEAGGD